MLGRLMGHTIRNRPLFLSFPTLTSPFPFLRTNHRGTTTAAASSVYLPQNRQRKAENPRLAAAMAGEDAAVSARAAAPRNQPKKGEVDEDEEDNMPISHSRAKKGNEKQKSTVNSKAKASKVKKDESESDDDFMSNSQKRSAAASKHKTSKIKKMKDEDLDDTKDQKKIKKVGVKEDEKKAAGVKVKRERKAYELPGQKHDPPPERDPLRIFYESLYEQVPTSEMAATWLMEWGLLPSDVAAEVLKRKGHKLKSPVKTTPVKRITSSPNKKAPLSSAKKINSVAKDAGKTTAQKKRKAISDTDDDDDDDDDIIISKTKTKRQKMITC